MATGELRVPTPCSLVWSGLWTGCPTDRGEDREREDDDEKFIIDEEVSSLESEGKGTPPALASQRAHYQRFARRIGPAAKWPVALPRERVWVAPRPVGSADLAFWLVREPTRRWNRGPDTLFRRDDSRHSQQTFATSATTHRRGAKSTFLR